MSYLVVRTAPAVSSASITKSGGSTTYAVGQLISNTSAAAMQFTSCLQSTGVGGVVVFGKLIKNSLTTSNAAFRMYVFNSDPGTTTDVATYAPTYANRATRVGWIDFVNGVTGSDNIEYSAVLSDANMLCNNSSGVSLYGQLVAMGAYASVTGEQYTINVGVLS